jgi:hypothetical protein
MFFVAGQHIMYDAVHWLRGISSRERAIMKKQCFFGGMTMPAAQLMLAPPSVLRRFCASHSITELSPSHK